ncbi:MAG: YhaI family protein [Bacillus sp. (in: Bacteria)]|nr:YhaI family protein [Bacillus sp. (in: firmicutes)]
MSEHELLLQRIKQLEYHQKLLFKLLINPKLELYKLFIENGVSEQEVERFYFSCDEMSIKLEEQKAEGYVYFYPLFDELSASLPVKLDIKEVIKACLRQNLYLPLFEEFRKYI